MGADLHVISLGAGVQSSTMALMAAKGELTPMPECAIFADTGDEPEAVYRWLKWICGEIPFPVHIVSRGILSDSSTRVRTSKNDRKYLKPGLPVFFANGRSIGARQCTLDFKVEPIRKKLRELRGSRKVIQWIGISRDEIIRMKPSRDSWCENIWPLVHAGIRREDCLRWMEQAGYPKPPRSACRYCPYHSNYEWRRLRDQEPQEFELAAQFEERLQSSYRELENFGTPYLHRSCVPLREVDLSTDVERGQSLLFGNECEGTCGV